MPVIKSAIKKLRKDRKREKENDAFRKSLDISIRAAKKQKSSPAIKKAVSLIDKAVKKNIIHKNKAARVKSALSKMVKPASAGKKTSPKKAKRTVPGKKTAKPTKKSSS